jgi:hypothetical protein
VNCLLAYPTAAQCLSIQAYLLAAKTRQRRLHPVHKRLRKGFRPNSAEHIAQGVVRWNPIRQLQETPQPRFLFATKLFHAHPVLDPAQYSAEHDHDNIAQLVQLVLGLTTRIIEVGKIGAGIG